MKNITIIAVFSLFLIGCGAPEVEPVSAKLQANADETIRTFAMPPSSANAKVLNMRSQTTGAISVLRNDLDSKGFSLNDCSSLKAYISSIDGQPADRKGFLTAYNRVFGTKLVPNKPQIILVEVLGFNNPEHLVLLEAQCGK